MVIEVWPYGVFWYMAAVIIHETPWPLDLHTVIYDELATDYKC